MDLEFFFEDREPVSVFMTHNDFLEKIFEQFTDEQKHKYCFNFLSGEYFGPYAVKCFEFCQKIGFASNKISDKPLKLIIH